jgi:hypothetical protein
MIRIFLAIVVALLAGTSAFADPLNGLPAAGTVLPAHSTHTGYEVVVPVPGDAGYKKVEVSSSDPDIKQVITSISTTSPRTNAVRSLDIRIDEPALAQRLYSITLLVTPQLGEKFERDLQIQIPAVTIDPIPTLIIQREVWWFSVSKINPSHPEIWVSGVPSWLTGIRFQQKGDTDAITSPSGQITFSGPFNMEPKYSRRFFYPGDFRLDGDFPLGVTRGNVVVSADQLAAPMTFAFEVHTGLSKLYLIPVIILGLLLGLTTRRFLQSMVQINQKREAAVVLVSVIDKAIADRGDPKFRRAALAAKEKALAAARSNNMATIDAETSAAQADFNTAVNDFQTRDIDYQTHLKNLKSVTGAQWRAPASVKKKILDLQSDIAQLPLSPDIDDAEAKLRQWTIDLGNSLVGAERALRQNIGELTSPSQLASLTRIAGEQAATQFSQSANAASDAMNNAILAQEHGDSSPSLDLVAKSLQAMHGCAVDLQDALTDLGSAIDSTVTGWANAMAGKVQKDPQAWNAALAAARGFGATLHTNADGAQDLPKGLGTLLQETLAAVANAIARQDSSNNAVAQAAQQGMFAAAIAQLAPAGATAPAVAEGENLVGEPLEAFRPGRAPGIRRPRTAAEAVSYRIVPSSPVVTFDMVKDAIDRNLRFASWTQNVIYFALISAGGYVIFQERWIGFFSDFMTVFAWAYAIDITADAVTTVFQRLGGR